MSGTQDGPPLPIPDNEDHLIAIMEDRLCRELSEQEENVAIAQAKLVGEL